MVYSVGLSFAPALGDVDKSNEDSSSKEDNEDKEGVSVYMRAHG